jgi:hypothetical protein
MYRCAHLVIKASEMRALELTPHLRSDVMPQYLEQTIQDAQSMEVALNQKKQKSGWYV